MADADQGLAMARAAPRHLGFYISLGVAVVATLATWPLGPPLPALAGANAFFLCYLILATRQIFRMDPAFLRRHAAAEDAPAPLILFVTVGAVAVSAVSLFFVLVDSGRGLPVVLPASIASVVLGWFAIHTMWAMHYAYEFYQAAAAPGHSRGGLDFPGSDEPDGTAFLYFSFVVGMTAQTSDTAVTSNAMRRLVTLHGMFSFFFNTIIVAAAVNIVITLAR
jgi:uncharacterized membrane protein